MHSTRDRGRSRCRSDAGVRGSRHKELKGEGQHTALEGSLRRVLTVDDQPCGRLSLDAKGLAAHVLCLRLVDMLAPALDSLEDPKRTPA